MLEPTLNSLGLASFRQISTSTEDDIGRFTEEIDTFPNRITRGDKGSAKKRMQRKMPRHN